MPARPALAIKVGNDPAARPQSGLSGADIVIEEPIEGAITRLLAIYQCHGATTVGPVRSTRWVDAQVLPQFDHPGFAFAGGIIPDERLVAGSGVVDLNFAHDPGPYYRISSRQAPENLYTSTAALWRQVRSKTPPPPIFSYAAPSGAGEAVTGADLAFSNIYSVQWRWSASKGVWVRYINGSVDSTPSGSPLMATNVVIERVDTYAGSIPEDIYGSLGVHSVTVGSGPLTVLTDGHALTGTWSRPSTAVPAKLADASGATIALAPGATWIELLPIGGYVAGSLTLEPSG